MLNLGILLEPYAAGSRFRASRGGAGAVLAWPVRGPPRLGGRGVQLVGVPGRHLPPQLPTQRPPTRQHRLPAGPQPLLLVPGVGRAQVLRVAQQHADRAARRRPTLGVALGCSAGCLSFYSVADSGSLGYRFLASFLEPLHPVVTVSSRASVTLKQV